MAVLLSQHEHPEQRSGICAAGSCQWCGCTFRRPSDVLRHHCAAMQEADQDWVERRDVLRSVPFCGPITREQDAALRSVNEERSEQLSGGFDSDDWDIVEQMRVQLTEDELLDRLQRFHRAAEHMMSAQREIDTGDGDLSEFGEMVDEVKAAYRYYMVAVSEEHR